MCLTKSLLAIVAIATVPPEAHRVVDEGAISHLMAPEQELVREYARQWPKVFEVYQSMAIQGSIYRESWSADQAEFVVDSEFKGSARILNNQMFRVSGQMPDGSTGMAIVTPTDVYGFSWNEDKQSYFLSSRFKAESRFMENYISQFAIHIEPFCNGEFHRLVFGTPQNGQQTVTLDRMEVSDEDGEEIVTATVICRGTNQGRDWTRFRVFKFLRNHYWAKQSDISAFVRIPEQDYTALVTVRCYYDGDHDGVPILKECLRESGTADFSADEVDRRRVFAPGNIRITSRERAIATTFTPGAPDLSEFDPAPYIKAVGGLGRTRSAVWLPTLYFVNSLLLLAFGLFLCRRKPRSSRSTHHVVGSA